MADITMCNGEGCEAKHTCYRFTAKANEYRQSYFTESPIKNNGCDMYWNNKEYMKKCINKKEMQAIIKGLKLNIEK